MKKIVRKIALLGAVVVLCEAAFMWNAARAENTEGFYAPPYPYEETSSPAGETHDSSVVSPDLASGNAPRGDSHAESSAGLPQLDVSTFPGQIFWLAVTFVMMYLIFSRKSLPEISSTLERRQRHIESDLETADHLKNEAETVLSTYETNLAKARTDSTKILHEAQSSIKSLAESRTNDFHEKSEKDMAALDKRLFALKESLMEDMNIIAAETAREAAKKIVGIQTDLEQAKTVVKALNIPSAKAA